MKKLQMLYRQTSTGATQQWQVMVERNIVHTFYGQVDGKLQQTQEFVIGKNVEIFGN